MDETQQHKIHDDESLIPLAIMTGLGIDISSANRLSQESDGGTTPSRKITPNPAQPYPMTPSTGGLSGTTAFGQSPGKVFSPDYSKALVRLSTSYHQSLPEDSEASLLHKHQSASLSSTYGEFSANHKCDSVKGVKGSRRTWLSIITILLSIYSTILSGIFSMLALVGPKYEVIRTNGKITPSTAALITTILAKTIELSFVTVIIALLGQELSRKASSTHRRSGVTLAELSMRGWIMQPGTMLSRWESVRYAGVSTLGLISVAAAVFAMLYTAAAAALVQPQLKYENWDLREMEGVVNTKCANSEWIAGQCFTPIPADVDSQYRLSTCLSIENAAEAYKNYYTYLGKWFNEDYSSEMVDRPSGTAWFSNDTVVIAPWIGNQLNHSAAFVSDPNKGITVNNVSLAFPHTGVAAAAKDKRNSIAQPEDLDGVGRYTINASVVSPVLHSLCATVSEDHLAPLVFSSWNITNETLNHDTWPAQLQFSDQHQSPYLGSTVLDGIFEWGEKYGDYSWPPIFMNLPQEFETMVNGTGGTGNYTQLYGRSSIYILGKGNVTDGQRHDSETLDFFLCQLQVSQTPYCYTSFQASGQGAVLEAVCDDETPPNSDSLRYVDGYPDALASRVFADRDWPMIATEVARALSLNDGAFEGKSANTRLLTQLLLREPTLDAKMPSLAEALAVLASCTLPQSTLNAPFIYYWNYTADQAPNGILEPGATETFNASISAQQYASGGAQPYQKAFHVVLLDVFMLNLMAFLYFATHKTWYVDFSEPPNLFSLAVNSPPSEALSGCCGTGPMGKDYGVARTLEQDQGHVFAHSGPRRSAEGSAVEEVIPPVQKRKVWRTVTESPVMKTFGRMRSWGKDA